MNSSEIGGNSGNNETDLKFAKQRRREMKPKLMSRASVAVLAAASFVVPNAAAAQAWKPERAVEPYCLVSAGRAAHPATVSGTSDSTRLPGSPRREASQR